MGAKFGKGVKKVGAKMAKLSLKFPPLGAKIGKKLGKKGKKIGKRSAMPLVPYPIPLKKLQKKLAPKGKIIGKFSRNLHGDNRTFLVHSFICKVQQHKFDKSTA